MERKKENLVSLLLPDTVLGNIHGLIYLIHVYKRGFPCGSVGKESSCNAGDPHSIPGSGISSGEGIGYPLQYSWASLVAQLAKNLPAIWENQHSVNPVEGVFAM